MPQSLLAGHDQFRRKWLAGGREFLQRLAADGQSPDALYIGCSDSRVVPELLTASAPGRLFVVRNIANVVPPLSHADASVGAALEYALGVLEVPNIIICGHYGCGGVKAMVDGGGGIAQHPSLFEWLQGVAPAVGRAHAEGHSGEELLRRAVEENVTQQLQNLFTFRLVADRVREGRLALHGWIYDMHTLALTVYDPGTDRFHPAQTLLAAESASPVTASPPV